MTPAGQPVRRTAHAKVNLFLEVLGKRPDGYHDVATLMAKVDLADELTFEPTDGLALACDVPELDCGPANLVMRAAERLQQETGCRLGARIGLEKKIPWAAGLGGGSSDAAATLSGLNELWRLGLSVAELMRIGGTVGSDVPFFLGGTAAWCTGRGEIVEPAAVGRDLSLVLVKPAVGLSTAEVFGRVRVPESPRSGEAARAALEAGDVEALGRSLFNRLEEAAVGLSDEVREWRDRLSGLDQVGVLMSGSGSSLFALFRNTSDARQAHDGLTRGRTSEGPSSARMFLVRSRR